MSMASGDAGESDVGEGSQSMMVVGSTREQQWQQYEIEVHALKLRDNPLKRSMKEPMLLEDILAANGESELYDEIMELGANAEDNPPLIFGWENIEAFVRTIHVSQGRPQGEVPNPPFDIPQNVTVHHFKELLLEYLRVPEAPRAIVLIIRTPGRLVYQSTRCSLNIDPFVLANNFPNVMVERMEGLVKMGEVAITSSSLCKYLSQSCLYSSF